MTTRLLTHFDRWRHASFPLIAAVIAACLAVFGRVWWCRNGDLWPWSWDVWSSHNSQHFVDPYTLSHLQHGIGLYVLLTLLFRRRTTAFSRSLLVALVEAAWEIMENTEWMIQRYREATISLGYAGDSILNSVCDYGACLAGVALAQRLPLWASAIVFAGLEIVSIVWIRDSLLINVLMLAWPLEAVRDWQMGGAP